MKTILKQSALSEFRRLLFFTVIVCAIPFVTNTFPFLENESMEISILIDTEQESESSELNDIDDDFLHMITKFHFDLKRRISNQNHFNQISFHLYYENTTPPPEGYLF